MPRPVLSGKLGWHRAPPVLPESPYDPVHSGSGAVRLRERTLLREGEALFEPTDFADEAYFRAYTMQAE